MPKKKKKKLKKNYIRKLTRVSTHSFAVVLPPAIIRKLKWRERQKLVVSLWRSTVRIRDWVKK